MPQQRTSASGRNLRPCCGERSRKHSSLSRTSHSCFFCYPHSWCLQLASLNEQRLDTGEGSHYPEVFRDLSLRGCTLVVDLLVSRFSNKLDRFVFRCRETLDDLVAFLNKCNLIYAFPPLTLLLYLL